jgi:hypothetical protein
MMYICVATDQFGNTASIELSIHIENGLTAEPVGDSERTINQGDSVTVTVNASATTGEMRYQWYIALYNEPQQTWEYTQLEGETNSSLTIDSVIETCILSCNVFDVYNTQKVVDFYITVNKDQLELTVGGSALAEISTGGDIALFSFVSETDGTYIFYSESSNDTCGYLYDADMNEITKDDDSGTNANFKIVYELTSGEQYWYGAKFYSSSNTGSFTVRLDVSQADENGLTYTDNHDGTCTVSGYEGKGTSVVIPGTYNDMIVTAIGDQVFYYQPSLTSITLPNSIQSIGAYAFSSCSGLTSFGIPAGVTSIGNRAFSGCSNLQAFTVEAGNPAYQSIDGVLFNAGATELIQFPAAKPITTYTVPASAPSIGDSAFSNCSAVSSVIIPDSVINLDGYIFDGSFSLTSVTLPNHLTAISNHIFMNCPNLTTVNIPSTVESIHYASFAGCSSLTGIVLPDGLKSILGSAFSGCSSLTDITIPATVIRIDYGAFSECSSVEGITVASGNTAYRSIDGVLFNADATELLQYPAGKTDSSYTVPASVTSIANRSFMGCDGLSSITIPSTVTSIGNELVFYHCSNLTINGEPSSYAEDYANSNGIPFVAIDSAVSNR